MLVPKMPMSNLARTLVVPLGLAVLAAPQAARAQISGDQAVSAAQSAGSALPPDTFGGELGFGLLGEDLFATLNLRLNFDRANWGFGLQMPLRFRLNDEPPTNDEDIGGFLRKEDWDEFADFLKVIRYVYVGQADKKGPYYVRVGELTNLTVGHGTIVYRYYNGFDLDTWRVGANVAVNVGAFGGELLMADVGRPEDPILAGGRLTVRPIALFMGDGFWDRLVFGVSVMADPKAPYRELNPAWKADDPTSTVPQFLDKPEKTVVVTGVDVGLEVLRESWVSIEPYVDLNKLNVVDNGWGLHLGVLWRFALPAAIDTLTLDLRTEYRRVSGDYVGPYFNTAYEVERVDSPPGSGTPRITDLLMNADAGKNGVFFDILAGLPEFAFVGGEFVDYDGGENDGTLRLSLHVPALEIVEFSAFYYRTGISGMNDLFELDDRSALVAEAKVPFYSVFTANVRWWRVWEKDAATSQYESVDDWSIGVGFALKI